MADFERKVKLFDGFPGETIMGLYQISKKIIVSLFEPEREQDFRFLPFIWLGGVYFLGIFLWGYFLGWRLVPFDYSDWVNINLPRLDVIRDALYYGQLPLHSKYIISLHGIDRFFALPDVITTPQMVLLRFVSLQTYILFDVFFFFSLGFAGLLWFRRHYKLSLIAFSLLVGLFSFNGHILVHYAVGHITWAGYFLFPAFFALMIKFVEEPPDWRWVAKVSFLMFYMVLAGSEHHFLWLLMFMGVLSVVEFRKFFWGFAAMVFSGLLSAVRLLPPAFSTSNFYSMGMKGPLSSYSSIDIPLKMMISYSAPGQNAYFQLPWLYWEYTLFIGLAATIFLFSFGLLPGLWNLFKANALSRTFRKFLLPGLFLFILSIGKNYEMLRATGITIFYGERAVSRMIIVPFVLLMIYATVNLQQWFNTHSKKFYILVGLSSVVIFYQLVDDLIVWQVKNAREAFGKEFIDVNYDLALNSITNHSDPVYFMALGVGLAITLAVSIFLIWQAQRKARHNQACAALK